MSNLVLIRHGQSQWNLENRFTGWKDIDLTPAGEVEARDGGRLLKEQGFDFDICYTSVLTRAVRRVSPTSSYPSRHTASGTPSDP